MIKHTLAALPAATLLALALTACGGSQPESNATTPAEFRSPDDVASLISAFNGTAGTFGIALSDSSGKSAAVGQAKSAGSMAKSTQNRSRAKATEVSSCSGGGSQSRTDDTSTLYDYDGLSVASGCRETVTQTGGSVSTLTNGKIVDKCVDNNQSLEDCNAYTVRIADGASGNTTFDVGVSSSGSAGNADIALRTKGDLLSSTSGDTDALSLNAVVAFSDNASRISGTVLFENLSISYTDNSNTGGGSETLNGSFGVSSSRSSCALGKVNVKTDRLIVTDSDDEPIDGQLTLTDGRGQQARVSFNSDGSTTVALANGQTRTYGAAQLASLCQ